MYTFDHGLFMALNFDGGTALDRVMLTISGTAMWLPLYALILWLVWRRSGWRGMSVFLVLMLLALGLSDIVSGIFKHNGLLGDMLPVSYTHLPALIASTSDQATRRPPA